MNNTGPRRLYRSVDDRWIAGVAAGVADYFDVDPVLIRIIWIISVPFTGFFSAVAYVVMALVVPLEPENWPPAPSPWQPGGDPSGPGAAFTTPPAGDPSTGSTPGAPTSGAAAAGAPNPSATGPAPAGPYWGWDARAQRRADRWQRRNDRWANRHHDNSGAIVAGTLLIVVGALFAWNQLDPNFDLGKVWPFAIIAFGVVLVATSFGWRRGE